MCKYEPLNHEEIFQVLRNAPLCILAVAENNQPYAIPMEYQWRYDDGRLYFLLQSNKSGKKMHCIERNRKVCLEFQYCDENTVKTVVAKGRIVSMEEESEGLVAIEIFATCVSGRAYAKKNI
ncbi:MAG: pyridoxamine 5'-phosphate oxidase family protein [Oscillospiraceae bacterium]